MVPRRVDGFRYPVPVEVPLHLPQLVLFKIHIGFGNSHQQRYVDTSQVTYSLVIIYQELTEYDLVEFKAGKIGTKSKNK